MAKTKTTAYLEDDTLAWLGHRAALMTTDPGAQLRVELDLWQAHLAAELRATTWTLSEVGCIADVLNRPVIDASVGSLLWTELTDAFDGLDGAWAAKWGVQEAALIDKARKLGATACHALTMAVAQWWDAGADHSVEGWRSIGVRVFGG